MKIQEKLLTINKFSRPGVPLRAAKGIVVHWVANPKTTAEQNRNYFET
jgi:N-acetylmuramoyl-L-alanine amidase CwlA